MISAREESAPSAPPVISIVTVVRNDLEGLKRTQASIAAQRSSDYEWVVVDGASTDGTVDYLVATASKFPLLRYSSGPDRGIYDAMNLGTSMARGDYVVFLNAGDHFADEDVLPVVGAWLRQQPQKGILFTGARFITTNGFSIYRPPRRASYIAHSMPASHQATYYPRKELGERPYDLAYLICGDYQLTATLVARGVQCFTLNRATAVFYAGGISSRRRSQLFREALSVQRKILGLSGFSRGISLIRRYFSALVVEVVSFWPSGSNAGRLR